jgi:MraZ protein
MKVKWEIVDKYVNKLTKLGITERTAMPFALNHPHQPCPSGAGLCSRHSRPFVDRGIDRRKMLIGEYQHTIDEKKRLAIPAKMRKELGRGAVLTRGLDNCLVLYPLKEWEKLAEKLSKLPTGQVEARGLARVIMSGAIAVEFDSLGRILVPDYLKQYASIKKNVVIAGVFSRVEVWDQKLWKTYKQKTEKTVGDMAAKLSELGF